MLKKGAKEGTLNENNKNINIDLQLNLLNTWTKFNVADYYQNIFLVHLDELTPSQAEELIKKEISLTLQKKSPYFQLEKLQKQRDNIIQKLQSSLRQAQRNETQGKLNQVCQDLKQLRQVNLIFAEQILKMYNIYHCEHIESTDKQMEYYDSMLSDLDKDNQFLKVSILKRHLKFDQGYDPFLMNQYQKIHRNRDQSINPAIKELFNLNISYAYRLMKTKNMILQLRSLVNRFDAQKISQVALTDRVKQNQSILSRRRYISKNESSRLAFDDERAKIPAKTSIPIKIQPINIYPSTFAKSRTTIYRDRDSRPETSSITQINQKPRLKFAKIPTDPSISDEYSYINIRPDKDSSFRRKELLQPNRAVDLNRKIKPYQNFLYDQRKKSIPLMKKNDERSPKPFKYKASVGQIYNRSIRLTPYKTYKQEQNRPEIYQSNQNEHKHRPKKNHQYEKPYKQSQRAKESQRQKQKQRERQRQREQQRQSQKQKQALQYTPAIYKEIKNYNPIKKQQYQAYQAQQPKKSKYDFIPQKISLPKLLKNSSKEIAEGQEDENGLVYEDPISKYNLQRKNNLNKKNNTEKQLRQKKSEKKANSKEINKVDKECQTIEMRKPPIKDEPTKKEQPSSPPPRIPETKKQQKQPEPEEQQNQEQQIEQQEEPPKPQKKTNTKQALNPDSDQTLQDQDIVDQRIHKNKPAIRTVSKQEKPKQSLKTQPITTNKTSNNHSSIIKNNNESKKEIRMKVGKATIQEVTQILRKSKIKNEYLNSFDLQKTIAWVSVSQTYLTEFTINDKTAIIALCSPIPNIGTALKFWAPLNDEIDLIASTNLFKKYLDFVQKFTTVEKIMFSGKPFKELEAGQFEMKKQNFYERPRKAPAPESNREFLPFVYIECSNIKFPNKSKGKILYSEEIQQFTEANSFATSFMAEANNSGIPASIKALIKFNSNLQDFKKVNQILTKQQFDNYEAAQIQASNIDLLRFYLNSPLKSTFIAQDNCFRFNGTVIHQKEKECVVGVGLTKNNGNIYFAKNVNFPQMLELIKKPSQARAFFTVVMFNKKLYGKMPQVEGGCYGNWQINLTWQDEMQGRIRHNMKQSIEFGPSNFKVLFEFQKAVVLGFEVNKQDLI